MPTTTKRGPTSSDTSATQMQVPCYRSEETQLEVWHMVYMVSTKSIKPRELCLWVSPNSNSHAAIQNPFLPLPHGKKWVCSICLPWLLLLSSITIILFCKSYSWHTSNHLSILSWASLGLFGKRMSLPVSGIFLRRVHAPSMLPWLLGVPK